jgi:DNA polymerase III delta prime subunit
MQVLVDVFIRSLVLGGPTDDILRGIDHPLGRVRRLHGGISVDDREIEKGVALITAPGEGSFPAAASSPSPNPQLDQMFKDSAVGTLSQIIGPASTEAVLAYIRNSNTLNSPEELDFVFTMLFGEAGGHTLEREMLKSVSIKLGDTHGPLVASEPFEIKQVVKKTISFNRMHGILAALQPGRSPRPDTDLRVTQTDGLTFDSDIVQSQFAGKYFRSIFEKVRKILSYQINATNKKSPPRRAGADGGITGFIFQGPPGMGKTAMARAIARDLALELVYVDSSTVARAKYGESEKQVMKAFEEARKGPSLILIDDAEAVFPSRDSPTSREEFYSGQNNVIFHQLDLVDKSKTVVILTTNKPEQLDPALRDRLYEIEFPELDLETIMEIARLKCYQRNIPPGEILGRIRADPDSVKSVRALEKMITEEYISTIERAGSVEREKSNEQTSSRSSTTESAEKRNQPSRLSPRTPGGPR